MSFNIDYSNSFNRQLFFEHIFLFRVFFPSIFSDYIFAMLISSTYVFLDGLWRVLGRAWELLKQCFLNNAVVSILLRTSERTRLGSVFSACFFLSQLSESEYSLLLLLI